MNTNKTLWKILLLTWIIYFCIIPLITFDIMLLGAKFFAVAIAQLILSALYLLAGLTLEHSRIKYLLIVITIYIILADIIFSVLYSSQNIYSSILSLPSILQLIITTAITILPSLFTFALLLINLYIILCSRNSI